jgi:hypothetical protein
MPRVGLPLRQPIGELWILLRCPPPSWPFRPLWCIAESGTESLGVDSAPGNVILDSCATGNASHPVVPSLAGKARLLERTPTFTVQPRSSLIRTTINLK